MIYRRTRSRKEVKHLPRGWWIVVVLLVLAALFLPLFFPYRFKHLSNYNLAIHNASGDITVVNFDPGESEITQITIPGNTELSVSRELGSWKAESLWQLGVNEHLTGDLVQETIIKNFSFPISAWGDEKALGLVSGNLFSIIKALILPYKSNMNWGDKLKLGILSLELAGKPTTNINLADTSLLKQVRLVDGEEGYVVVGEVPPKVSAIFADDLFSRKQVRVIIKNDSGNLAVVEGVGRVIEVWGAKVTSTVIEDSSNFNCRVIGRDRVVTDIFGSLFGCEKVNAGPQGNFDVEIDLGELFATRF